MFQTPLNKDGSLRQKKQRIQYIAPPPRVKKKMEEEPLVVHEALYKVTVYTGIVAGAGTDANVSVVAVIGGGGQGLYSHCIYTNATVSVVAVIGVVDGVCTKSLCIPGLYQGPALMPT